MDSLDKRKFHHKSKWALESLYTFKRCLATESKDRNYYLHLHNSNYHHKHWLQKTLESVSFAFSLPVTPFLARVEQCPANTERRKINTSEKEQTPYSNPAGQWFDIPLRLLWLCLWFSRPSGITLTLSKCQRRLLNRKHTR